MAVSALRVGVVGAAMVIWLPAPVVVDPRYSTLSAPMAALATEPSPALASPWLRLVMNWVAVRLVPGTMVTSVALPPLTVSLNWSDSNAVTVIGNVMLEPLTTPLAPFPNLQRLAAVPLSWVCSSDSWRFWQRFSEPWKND